MAIKGHVPTNTKAIHSKKREKAKACPVCDWSADDWITGYQNAENAAFWMAELGEYYEGVRYLRCISRTGKIGQCNINEDTKEAVEESEKSGKAWRQYAKAA